MKPSQRVLVGALVGPTAIIIGISLLIPSIWNAPVFALIVFGIIWLACCSAFVEGGLQHEALRYMDRAAEPPQPALLPHQVQKNGTMQRGFAIYLFVLLGLFLLLNAG